ncbi:hypothetical protein [Halalkalibacterium ligniniphilum]|uniref:hypothetical protein n=1 Tax=Halalkalibacterium ligniniphilum TaxID=1134413 RepID=UPI000347E4D5|nr:hypothetical protein [Halalkalibacterium ligniniphilum]
MVIGSTLLVGLVFSLFFGVMMLGNHTAKVIEHELGERAIEQLEQLDAQLHGKPK